MSLKTTMGNLFFKWRSYTPIPLLLAVLLLARPTLATIVIGMAVACAGELTRIWAVSYAGGATRTLEPGVGELITGGPFSFIRNPLYAGNFLLSLGICIAAWPSAWSYGPGIPWMLPVFIVAFAIQYGFIVALEEQTIREKLGERYEAYYRAVPRWFPRLTPYRPRYPEQGDFKAGFRSDRRSIQTSCIVLLVILVIFMVRLFH